MDVPTSLTGTDIGGMVREDFERSRAGPILSRSLLSLLSRETDMREGMGGLGSAASEPRPGYISPQEVSLDYRTVPVPVTVSVVVKCNGWCPAANLTSHTHGSSGRV